MNRVNVKRPCVFTQQLYYRHHLDFAKLKSQKVTDELKTLIKNGGQTTVKELINCGLSPVLDTNRYFLYSLFKSIESWSIGCTQTKLLPRLLDGNGEGLFQWRFQVIHRLE